MVALDEAAIEAATCMLAAGDRILFEHDAEGGWDGGRVVGLDQEGRVTIKLDHERSERCVERPAVLKAPPPTDMRVGQSVRVAFDHEDLQAGSMRWQFGVISKVHAGGELVDLAYENGELSAVVPTYDVERV